MRTRSFGRTLWQVSEIGVGTWSMGGLWGPIDDAEAIRALHCAIDKGVNFIDTAWVYGEGHSETLMGQALAQRSESITVATKVPPKNMEWPARHTVPVAETFPPEWITRCTEQSLSRLSRDTVDLQQLHVWSTHWLAEQDVWMPAVDRLKRSGKIRAFGISVNDYEPETALEVVASGLIDSVQVIYNIFEQLPAEALFTACQEHDVAVIVRVPFDEGSLTGTFSEQMTFHPEDWRAAYFQGDRLKETVERVEQVRSSLSGREETLAQSALRFCLSHDAVSTVIPGMRRVAHVQDNCQVSDGQRFSQAELEALRQQAWRRNFYRTDQDVSIFA